MKRATLDGSPFLAFHRPARVISLFETLEKLENSSSRRHRLFDTREVSCPRDLDQPSLRHRRRHRLRDRRWCDHVLLADDDQRRNPEQGAQQRGTVRPVPHGRKCTDDPRDWGVEDHGPNRLDDLGWDTRREEPG